MDAIDQGIGAGERFVNLAALVDAAARAHPDAEAMVDERRRLTWAELDREVAAVAEGLSRLGVVAGHRVGILLPNRVEFVTTYLGVLAAGMVAVPLNPGSTTGEVVRVLADCTARVVVCDASTATTTRSAVAGLADALTGADDDLRARAVVPHVVVVDAPTVPEETTYAAVVADARRPAPPPQDPETLAALLYTAGTSGRPRAAMLSHRALLANVEQAAALRPPPLERADRVLGVLPLFHVYGLNAVLGQVLRQGACLVLAERFDEDGTLDLLRRESVTNVPIAPAAVAAWASRADLRDRIVGVHTVLSGASSLPPEVARRFQNACGIAVHQGYGLTEAGPAVTSTLASGASPKPGSVGRPLPGVDVTVVDDAGVEVGDRDAGEIWVRGPNLFDGYWPDGAGGPDTDGWFATGDVGYLDADGDLFLVDRLREIVVVSGFNVYPVEVEEAILEVEDVIEAAVVGAEDAATGQAVVAYVVADVDSGASTEKVADRVRTHCEHRLARFKQPRDVHVVGELPHSVSGKVAKGRLREDVRRRAQGLPPGVA